jgi:hypothetical protein
MWPSDALILCPASVQKNMPPPSAKNPRRSTPPSPQFIAARPDYFLTTTVICICVGWIVQMKW